MSVSTLQLRSPKPPGRGVVPSYPDGGEAGGVSTQASCRATGSPLQGTYASGTDRMTVWHRVGNTGLEMDARGSRSRCSLC